MPTPVDEARANLLVALAHDVGCAWLSDLEPASCKCQASQSLDALLIAVHDDLEKRIIALEDLTSPVRSRAFGRRSADDA